MVAAGNDGCGAPVGGVSLAGVDPAKEVVIAGVVSRAGDPVAGAYVRLLDSGGEFTAEVPTDTDGGFRFLARPGDWTVRTLAPGAGVVDSPVSADYGSVAEVAVSV